ncbi:perosamine synthetase-related protein [Vibrio parahaemolyticus]|nr:perosamine synthetase-related protein [Vibrio parahaemolyticus]
MILKSAKNREACIHPYVFTKNARTAWLKILNMIGEVNSNSLSLLLPSYIGINDKEGSGVFDAVQASDSKADFYKLTDDLQVDLEDFEFRLKNKRYDIVLVIHYFGVSRVDMSKIKDLCNKYSTILVEDCAHAFYFGNSGESLGDYGDFSFYSLHKYLASSGGGMLKINNNSFRKPMVDENETISNCDLECFASSDFRKIADLRKRNYISYQAKLKSNENFEVMFSYNENDIPQTFPLRIKNGLREKLYFYLYEHGVPTVALYYRLIPQIEKNSYHNSYLISSEILNLPVHQDTTSVDIEYICNKISQFFNENKSEM